MQRNADKKMAPRIQAIAQKCNQSEFGTNTFVFDPSMDMNEIQELLDSIHAGLTFPDYEFTSQRYAYLFKPGVYQLDIQVGYYTHVIGLGQSPDDVVIQGAVRSNATKGHVLCNFWRSVENLTIEPTGGNNIWGVSQAAPLRRVHVKGDLTLFEGASSGGFMADCKIDGKVISGSQQQWFSRNSEFQQWDGGVWNMVYLGVKNAPAENWPEKPVTTIPLTPEVREKPYWTFTNNTYQLVIPSLKKNSEGIDWSNTRLKEQRIPLTDFHIAYPGKDNAASLNKALQQGKHLLFTPGIYQLEECIRVTRPGTVVMGIGMATLIPLHGNKALSTANVPGISIISLVVDASSTPSETLVEIGDKHPTTKKHKKDPIFLYDVFFRIGGAQEGSANSCMTINSNNVYVDHAWFWRADHGNGIGWDKSKCANGLIVNGHDVTVYGLFNEHFQEYQTIWNGERGRVYFYQCELPYDPPTNDIWSHDNILGYASYKVADHVKKHQAWGIGIYGFFDTPLIVDRLIETPASVEDCFYHKVGIMLGWNKKTDTVFRHIINDKGGPVDTNQRKQTMK